MNQPDAKTRIYISLVKSGIRILAGGNFIVGFVVTGVILIILAELLGIVEELV
jgi:hypothetical protein